MTLSVLYFKHPDWDGVHPLAITTNAQAEVLRCALMNHYSEDFLNDELQIAVPDNGQLALWKCYIEGTVNEPDDVDLTFIAELREFCCRVLGQSGTRHADAVELDAAEAGRTGAVEAKPKTTKAEANIKAREYLREHPDASARELSAGIGCGLGMVSHLPIWRVFQEQRKKRKKPRQPSAASLTDKMQAVTGKEDNPLDKLIAEQEADDEPSPLESTPSKVKIYRKP